MVGARQLFTLTMQSCSRQPHGRHTCYVALDNQARCKRYWGRLKLVSCYLQEYTAAAFSMCTAQQWTVVPLNPGEPLETALAIPKLPSMGTCWMGFVLAPTFQPSGGGPGGLSVMQVQWCALPHPWLIIDDPQQTAAIHPGMNLHEAVGPGAAAHCPAPHAAYS